MYSQMCSINRLFYIYPIHIFYLKMKIKYLALLLFPLSLAACQSHNVQNAGDMTLSSHQQALKQQDPAQVLTAYEWSNNTANAPKPLVLRFNEKQRLSISTNCNRVGGAWKIDGQSIEVGDMMSTMMACTNSSMQQESLALALFSKRKVPFVLDVNDIEKPTLTIRALDGQSYVFAGKMTAETKYQSTGETIFLEVSPETKSCTGVAPQTCLQVREIKYAENGVKSQVDKDWTLFYDHIEGFQHTPNERQVIRVKRYEIKNPAADQSKYAYVHDMTIEHESVKGAL